MERKIVFEVPKAIFYTMSQCRLKSLIPSYLSLSLSLWLIYEVINFKWDLIILVIQWPNQIGSFMFPFVWNINSLPKAKEGHFHIFPFKKEVVHQWRHNEGLWHNSKFVWRHLWTYQKIFGIFLYQHKASCHKRSIHTEWKRKW